jgi:hypothetical protein
MSTTAPSTTDIVDNGRRLHGVQHLPQLPTWYGTQVLRHLYPSTLPHLLRDAEHLFDPPRPLFGAPHNPGPLLLLRDAMGILPPSLTYPVLM